MIDPETVDPMSEGGADLLDDVRQVINRFCVLPGRHEVVAVALWVALTHLLEKFDYAPRLHIRAPEKRSGKTRLLTIVKGLVYSPLPTANCTTAYIYRSIGDGRPPTLLFDEVDALFGTKRAAENNEDLRALLNAGSERDAPVGRTVGPQHTPQEFATFAMAALTGIGRLPDTIEDRAVVVAMKRRTKDEKVASFRRRRDQAGLDELRDRIAAWAELVRERAGTEYPELAIDDRAADIWEPLVTVADLAGGHWPELARAAAAALSAESAEDDTQSLNVRLLNDIEALLLDGLIGSFVKSADLCEQLRKLVESPWADIELSPPKLGKRLSTNFRIRTRQTSGGKERGYYLTDFADAFARYPRQTPSHPVTNDADQHEQPESSPLATPSQPRHTPSAPGSETNGEGDLGQGCDRVVTGLDENDNPSSDGINTGCDGVGRGNGQKVVSPPDTDDCCLTCGTPLTEAQTGYCTTECADEYESDD